MNQKPQSEKPQKLNLLMSIALVAGTMIGSGVFLLPSALAAFGGISLLGWIFTTLGALLLALALSRLSRIIPKAGGPYAFTTVAFGEFPGFLVGWSYWIALMVGQAAVAVAAVGYLGVFNENLANTPSLSAIIAVFMIWSLVILNIGGIREAGVVQLTTAILKVLPLFLIIGLGIYLWDFSNFTPFNNSETDTFGAVTATASMTLWAFLGIESATVAAENVKDPEVNVAKATLFGTSIAAVIYILSSMAVMMIIPLETLQSSTAPFADAAKAILGTSAQYVVAIGAIISCLGALNGMVMLSGQMPYAFARDKLFAPKYAHLSRKGTPRLALITVGIIVTVFVVMNFSKSLVELFTFLMLLSTLSMLLPLAFATMSEIMMLVKNPKNIGAMKSRKSLILGLLAFAYVIWMILGSGEKVVYWGFLLFILGMPFYVLFKWLNRDSE